MRPNPPDGRELLTRLLTRNRSISELLSKGLEGFLAGAGATPAFRDVVGEFVRPALVLLAETERDTISFVQHGGREELPFAQEIDESEIER
jgi:hypothetical protein